MPEVGQRIFGNLPEMGLVYVSSPADLAGAPSLEIAEAILAAELERVLVAETRSRRALVGPQRDDLGVTLAGHEAVSYASAGEQRRAAFVLTMAAREMAEERDGAGTLLLVDDVEAELDDERLDQALGYLADAGQALVSTSKEHVAARYRSRGVLLHVEDGRIA